MSGAPAPREAESGVCPLFGCAGRHEGGVQQSVQDTQVPDWKSFSSL